MRRLNLAPAAGALALFLCACGGGGGDGDLDSGPSGPSGNVTVTKGFADGYQTSSGTVHVFAEPSTNKQVFDHWTGNVTLADPKSWHTTFPSTSSPVTLQAVYKTIAGWTEQEISFGGGKNFDYYVPSSPKGLIFFFHGRGGTARQWFKDPEFLEFVRQAVGRGYGVASLDSSDRIQGDWTLLPTNAENPDIGNVQAGVALLKTAGKITSQTPIYAVGFSNGASFATVLCDFIGCAAVATVSAQSIPAVVDTTVPTRFNMNQHDSQDLVDNTQAQQYSQLLRGSGVPSEVEIHGPSPVYPQRFARISDLSASDSTAIWQALSSGGFLDERNFLKADPYEDASGWEEVIPSKYKVNPLTFLYITEEIYNAYSSHEFYSEHFPRTMAFFEDPS